jgi:hypothetical protein
VHVETMSSSQSRVGALGVGDYLVQALTAGLRPGLNVIVSPAQCDYNSHIREDENAENPIEGCHVDDVVPIGLFQSWIVATLADFCTTPGTTPICKMIPRTFRCF